jgi:hypothetical protein
MFYYWQLGACIEKQTAIPPREEPVSHTQGQWVAVLQATGYLQKFGQILSL